MLLQLIRNGLDLMVYLEHKLNTRILHHLPYSDRQESREDANKRTLEQMTGCGYCDKRSRFLCDECDSATGKSTVNCGSVLMDGHLRTVATNGNVNLILPILSIHFDPKSTISFVHHVALT